VQRMGHTHETEHVRCAWGLCALVFNTPPDE
jgi:hypothetical protein